MLFGTVFADRRRGASAQSPRPGRRSPNAIQADAAVQLDVHLFGPVRTLAQRPAPGSETGQLRRRSCRAPARSPDRAAPSARPNQVIASACLNGVQRREAAAPPRPTRRARRRSAPGIAANAVCAAWSEAVRRPAARRPNCAGRRSPCARLILRQLQVGIGQEIERRGSWPGFAAGLAANCRHRGWWHTPAGAASAARLDRIASGHMPERGKGMRRHVQGVRRRRRQRRIAARRRQAPSRRSARSRNCESGRWAMPGWSGLRPSAAVREFRPP